MSEGSNPEKKKSLLERLITQTKPTPEKSQSTSENKLVTPENKSPSDKNLAPEKKKVLPEKKKSTPEKKSPSKKSPVRTETLPSPREVQILGFYFWINVFWSWLDFGGSNK